VRTRLGQSRLRPFGSEILERSIDASGHVFQGTTIGVNERTPQVEPRPADT
jgi:hypothetical protein